MFAPTARIPRAAAPTLAIALAIVVGFAVAPADAEDGSHVTWSVQPSTPDGPDGRNEFDYQVAPGTTISDWVAVTNYSDHAVTFRVYGADATTDYTTGAFTLIGADHTSTDLGSWTSIDSHQAACGVEGTEADADCIAQLGTEITLEAGKLANIPFTITVPADATPGDHAAGIVASFRSPSTTADGSSVQVEQRVGTRIYLRVDGDLAPAVHVSGSVASYSGSVNPVGSGTGTIDFDITNTGNVMLDAVPKVTLTGPFGIGLGTATGDTIQNLVPRGTAHVSIDITGVAPLLLMNANISVAATPVGDTTSVLTDASARAWAVPWLAVIFVILLVGGTWGFIAHRNRSRRLLAEELADYADRVRAEAIPPHTPTEESEHSR